MERVQNAKQQNCFAKTYLQIIVSYVRFYARGVRGGIRTHGPRIHTTSTFAATISLIVFVVWTVPSSWISEEIDRCCPTSLYTFLFPPNEKRLGSGSTRRKHARVFPEFEQIHCAVSHHSAQLT